MSALHDYPDNEPILRISATVSVNLDHRHDEEHPDLDRADRKALCRLETVPAGAHVRIVVGRRSILTVSAVQWLHEAARRLDVEIDATDAAVVRLWHQAITSGRL